MPPEGSRAPERQCIVTRQSFPKDQLIRFVIGPDNQVVPDINGKLPGRGLWLKADRQVLSRAIQNYSFKKAAKQNVVVPDHLPAQVERAFRDQCLNLISLANRAGEVAAGFEKVLQILRSGKAGVYVSASAADSDSRKKIESLLKSAPVVTLFSEEELGRCVGRDSATHLVIRPGGLCDKFLSYTRRLEGLLATTNEEVN